jgi:HD-like signal output (HDOD) protein
MHAFSYHTSAPPLSGDDADAPGPAKRARLIGPGLPGPLDGHTPPGAVTASQYPRGKRINARLLLDIHDLGREGIRDAGGLTELARQHDVSFNSLRQFIHKDGSLTAQGQAKIKRDVLTLPTQPITSRLLQELSTLGREHIQRAGGVAELARQHDVSVRSLGQLIRDDGSLTARGRAKINREVLALPTQPITGRLLQEVLALGPDGIKRAGGVAALASQHEVSVRSLAHLIREDGSLTASGQAKINREVLALPTQPITGRLLQELSALGPDGIKRAGGVAALASQHTVSVNSLVHFIREDGSLTAQGRAKINREVLTLPTQPITCRLLQELSALGREGIRCAGGLAALASQRDVSFRTLGQLIHSDGSLTALGRGKINREVLALPPQPITGQLLQELSALGREGIGRAGGVSAWASQHDVSVSSLRRLIREDGSLTANGRAKIDREVSGNSMPSAIAPQLSTPSRKM